MTRDAVEFGYTTEELDDDDRMPKEPVPRKLEDDEMLTDVLIVLVILEVKNDSPELVRLDGLLLDRDVKIPPVVDAETLELADTEYEKGIDDETGELDVAAPGETHEHAEEILGGE